jgi:hypothetical protein
MMHRLKLWNDDDDDGQHARRIDTRGVTSTRDPSLQRSNQSIQIPLNTKNEKRLYLKQTDFLN